MNCDYKMLEKYAAEMKNELKKISDLITSMEDNFDKVCNSEWNSPVKDYFSKQKIQLMKNNNICFNKMTNINNYLQNVINNYRIAENQMKASVSNLFGGFNK